MDRKYQVYKGLQKPLIFKGFKGRFIYWGVGCLLTGLILGALTMSLINGWLGAIVLAGCTGGGLWYISQKQKNGLYDKTRHNNIQILRLHAQTKL